MKAGVIITGTGAILVLTACDSFDHPDAVNSLRRKGITRYIAFEVPVDLVKTQYGRHFSITLADRGQSDACRVVDVDGSRIFQNFSLNVFGQPIMHDEAAISRKAA